MLGKMAGNKSTCVHLLTMKIGPKKEKLSHPHPIQAICLDKGMISSESLEEYGVAYPRGLGGLHLVWSP